MIKKMLWGCCLVLFTGLVLIIVGLNQLWHVFLINKDEDQTVDFVVEEGESFKSVAERLDEQKIVASAFWFRLTAELAGLTDDVQSGVHMMVPGDNYSDTLGRLIVPSQANEVRVTIPEGYTLNQMGALLAAKGLVTAAEWKTATGVDSPLEQHAFVVAAQKPNDIDLEGYLFPDTYRFALDATADSIALAMLENMQGRVVALGEPAGQIQDMTLHEILTLASIVEREVRQPATMKNVADIFLKRLEIGMALQADSTVNYITGGDDPSISLEDRDNTDSPYNTYLNPGLPPGPISAPSMNALNAVFNPTANNYYYFLTTDDGEIYYAETHDQHVTNKNRYLK